MVFMFIVQFKPNDENGLHIAAWPTKTFPNIANSTN